MEVRVGRALFVQRQDTTSIAARVHSTSANVAGANLRCHPDIFDSSRDPPSTRTGRFPSHGNASQAGGCSLALRSKGTGRNSSASKNWSGKGYRVWLVICICIYVDPIQLDEVKLSSIQQSPLQGDRPLAKISIARTQVPRSFTLRYASLRSAGASRSAMPRRSSRYVAARR